MRFRHTKTLYMDLTIYVRKNCVTSARKIISKKKKYIMCEGKTPLVNAHYRHMEYLV